MNSFFLLFTKYSKQIDYVSFDFNHFLPLVYTDLLLFFKSNGSNSFSFKKQNPFFLLSVTFSRLTITYFVVTTKVGNSNRFIPEVVDHQITASHIIMAGSIVTCMGIIAMNRYVIAGFDLRSLSVDIELGTEFRVKQFNLSKATATKPRYFCYNLQGLSYIKYIVILSNKLNFYLKKTS